MSLILKEDYIAGFSNMPVGTLDSVADECTFLEDEVSAVSVWGWIFVRPVYLGAEVTKHWIFKKDEIKQSAATSEQLWNEGKPYAAGMEAANAMKLGVGPLSLYVPRVPAGGSYVNMSQESDSNLVNLADLPFTPKYAAEVIAVFLGELAYQNRFNNIS